MIHSIKITGETAASGTHLRHVVRINNIPWLFTFRELEILQSLTTGIQKGTPWVHRGEWGGDHAAYEVMHRLRKQLRMLPMLGGGEHIENNGDGYYRLINHSNIEVDMNGA